MTDMLAKITEVFGADGNHWSCLGNDGERQMRSLLSLARPIHGECYGTIIEIGTHQGVSACLLSEYAQQVITFDVKDWWLRKDVMEFLGCQVDFRLLKANTAKDSNREISDILKGLDFDLAFIDGDHSYESVCDNFEAVKRCGRVIFHDYKHNKCHLPKTVKFVDSIPDGRTTKLEPFALWERWPNE